MKPGRELDALIAVNVMGEKPCIIQSRRNGTITMHPGSVNFQGPDWHIPAKPYSTSIEDAWEVVEKLRYNGKHLDLSGATTWEARFTGMTEPVEAESAPLAICLAALKAVGGV